MSPASTLVARNVREDIGTAFVAALLLASVLLLLCIATLGWPSDAADGVLPASPQPQPASDTAAAFAHAPVYRLDPVTIVGHRDDASPTVAREHPAVAPRQAQAKPASAPRA